MFIEGMTHYSMCDPQPGSNSVDLATSFYKYLTSPRSFTTQVDQTYFYSLNQQTLNTSKFLFFDVITGCGFQKLQSSGLFVKDKV